MPLVPKVGRRRWKLRFTIGAIAVFLWLGVALHLFPVWWMFTTTIKPFEEIFVFPPRLWPEHPTLYVYKLIFRVVSGNPVIRYPVYVYFKNSVIITLGTMLLQIPLTALIAYSVSKLMGPKTSRFIFLLCIGLLMVPGSLALIPSYMLVKHFPFPLLSVPHIPFINRSFPTVNFVGTYWAVILPAGFSAFNFLLFKGWFDTIPDELINAARLDGASELGLLRRIILPVSKPVFAVVTYFTFGAAWNQFMWPLIVLRKNELYPMSVMMYKFQQFLEHYYSLENPQGQQLELARAGIGFNGLMVMAIVESIPVFIMFIVFREYLMKGIKLRGFK